LFSRFRAAGRLLILLPVVGKVEEAAELARNVIDLIPNVSSRSLDRKDRQFVMSRFLAQRLALAPSFSRSRSWIKL
jgi:hypothetical protein